MGVIRQAARAVLVLDFLFALLLAFSVPFSTFDAQTQVVTALALVPIALSGTGAAAVIATEWDPI